MTEKLQQTIKEEVQKLPKETREVINSFDWPKIAGEIGEKYLLSESEINDFQVETLLVLVGLEDGDSYARNIENSVGTAKDEAIEMADEAFDKIFTPINNIMEENIKKNLKSKSPNPEQTLNFILSGGDYSAFVEEGDVAMSAYPDAQKTNIPISAKRRITDIKSKFTI